MADIWDSFSADPSQVSVHQQLPVLNTGSALYYVSSQETGGDETEEGWIQKSTDSGATWTNVYNGPKVFQAEEYNAVLAGSNILIFSAQFSPLGLPLKVFIFDTLTDTMLADGADGPSVIFRNVYAQVQSDGKVLVCFFTSDIPGPSTLAVALYDPDADSWGTPVLSSLLLSTANGVAGIATDENEISYIVYGTVAAGLDRAFRCVPVTRVGSVLTFGTDVQVGIFPASSSLGDVFTNAGRPVVVPETSELVIPYLSIEAKPDIDPPQWTGTLYLARSPLGASLAFSSDLLIEYPGPPPATEPIIYSMSLEFGAMGGWSVAASVVFQGKLYIFWVDAEMSPPGGYQSPIPGGTARLRYVTSTGPGEYSAPQTAFTIGESAFGQPYPVVVSDDVLGILLPRFDPTLFFESDYAALNMFFLRLGSPTPPPAISNVIVQLIGWKLYPVNSCGPLAEMTEPARPWWETGKKVC